MKIYTLDDLKQSNKQKSKSKNQILRQKFLFFQKPINLNNGKY